jgi:hypothetical protein
MPGITDVLFYHKRPEIIFLCACLCRQQAEIAAEVRRLDALCLRVGSGLACCTFHEKWG